MYRDRGRLSESRRLIGSRGSSSEPARSPIVAVEEQEPRLPPPRRYKAGFITRSSFQRLFLCKSPSTDSTTSLAQLREKLTSLAPLNYIKAPTKIALTPELSVLKEQDEFDRLSNSEPKRRCGVSLKKQYQSDSETVRQKKTRYLRPVAEEHSTSLSAAVGLTDQSVIDEAFEKLYKKDSQVDLANLLVEEAIQHGHDKDSGIISEKVTQDSDFVENTPLEPMRRKKIGVNRRPEETTNTTDDSDVVDDTPCNDHDWRKKVKSRSNKINKNNSDEIDTLNEEAVDAYFCQQTNYIDLISPATIKKISESLSHNEDTDDDSIVIEDIKTVKKEKCQVDLALKAHIVDWVNDLLDKVFSELDEYYDSLAEQQQHVKILTAAHSIDRRSNDTSNILKMNKYRFKPADDVSGEDHSDCGKKVTLKFKPKKQASKTNTRRNQAKHSNNIVEDNVLKENINTKSPTTIQQLIRKKRKLYSPKDDDIGNDELPRSKKDRRPSSCAESPIATCYKELEKARKSRIRLPRKRTSTEPVLSPKAKKLNDIFDKIKDNVVNEEKITLVDKKSEKEITLYNMSSESDDEAFKKKKIQVQKRISSSSLESTSKQRKSVKSVNYTAYYDNYSMENEQKRISKPKPVKQTKPRSRKIKKNQKTNLIDERMRNQPHEMLNTSFVQETCETIIADEPEPALQVPILEAIPADDLHAEPFVSESKAKIQNKSEIIKIKTEKGLKKRCDKLTKATTVKKSKETIKNVPTERGSATVSPLPGLVVESESESRKDDLTSSIEANLLQKFKKIYTEVDDLNTTRDTQNLLVYNKNEGIEAVLCDTGDGPNFINLDNYNENAVAPTENVQIVDLSYVASEKSIATGGRSPITGHNDLDEAPPNVEALYESFQHRDVDVEGQNRSIAEFLDNMRKQAINSKPARTSPIIPITRMSSKISLRSKLGDNQKPIDTSSSDKSTPRVVLERMSLGDVEIHRNPVIPKSKGSASVVLTRISTEDIEKNVTPRKMKSSTTGLPVVALDRLSSDEIDKWLPMPGIKEKIVEEPARISTRRRSVPKACITCVKPANKKSLISPVKLIFDVANLTSSRLTRSRSRSIKKIPVHYKIENVRMESVKSVAEDNVTQGSRETLVKSLTETSKMTKKDKESTVDPSEMSKSVASVNDWIKRNEAAGSSKTDDMAATKELLYQEVMETLRTRLVEINESTNEAMQAAFLKDQEEITKVLELEEATRRSLQKLADEHDRMNAMIISLQKNKMDRACVLIRNDAENKARMVRLLIEDIERILK